MPTILGVSAYYHDAAACLVRDGEIVAAAQEERFTRKKHDASFPRNAVEYCLGEAGIAGAELDYVGFYDKPLLKFERLLENYCGVAPRGLRSFLTAMPVWLKEKLFTREEIRKALGGYAPPGAVRRASRIARGERLLPFALRRKDDADWRREFALD